MRLQNLLLVGAGAAALATMAAGAPVTAAAGAIMLAATALRNTHVSPETCLTFDNKEQYCHYKNECDFPVSATSGRGFNIVEGKGRASCLRDDNGPIRPDRGDVTIKANPTARECVVVHESKQKHNQPAQTDIRNHCNQDVSVIIEEECEGTAFPIPVPKRQKIKTSINFNCFGEKDIKVEFETKKTNN